MKRRTFVLSTVLSPFILSAGNDWSSTSITYNADNKPPVPTDPYWDDAGGGRVVVPSGT